MLSIPEVTAVDIAFGDIKHMPKYEDLPEEFRDWHHNPHCEAMGRWFFKGAAMVEGGIRIGDETYLTKPGVDRGKALAAIRAVLGSFAPKHEHKMAACGFMLAEWFDRPAL